jgi:hypothetical protein
MLDQVEQGQPAGVRAAEANDLDKQAGRSAGLVTTVNGDAALHLGLILRRSPG